ncbi:D-aminoacyl-tRNA deacylase [soil metagenome]
MIAVVQRVIRGKVTVHDRVVGEIAHGIVALVSVERDDTAEQIRWMAEKLVGLRIFRSDDGQKHFERDVKQVGGSMLLVSNFTVAAATRKGRRPSLDGAADPETGRVLFDQFVTIVKSLAVPVATGEFGADMIVSIENDGPATFIIQSDV